MSAEQLNIFRDRLETLNIRNRKELSYERAEETSITDRSAKSTLWVDGRAAAPRVYLEDHEITVSVWVIYEGGNMYYQMTRVRLHLRAFGFECIILSTNA